MLLAIISMFSTWRTPRSTSASRCCSTTVFSPVAAQRHWRTRRADARGSPCSAPKQREEHDVNPAENAVDDRPEDRVIVRIGDRNRQGRAEAYAIFRAFDANPIITAS